jgi:hypothetical protein
MAGLSLWSALADSVGAVADGVGAAGWVAADDGALVGGALLWVGATAGPLVAPLLVACDVGEAWWLFDVVCWPPECEPPSLCCGDGLCVGFGVGLCVGLGVGLWVGFLVGWAGGGAVVWGGAGGGVGCCTGVGVLWVGAAAAGDWAAGPSVPAALWGHQAIRHAATPSNAATATRTAFVQVLLTSSSLTP